MFFCFFFPVLIGANAFVSTVTAGKAAVSVVMQSQVNMMWLYQRTISPPPPATLSHALSKLCLFLVSNYLSNPLFLPTFSSRPVFVSGVYKPLYLLSICIPSSSNFFLCLIFPHFLLLYLFFLYYILSLFLISSCFSFFSLFSHPFPVSPFLLSFLPFLSLTFFVHL